MMNKPCKIYRTRGARQRRAAAAVEFAMIAPLLAVIAFGAIDIGQCVNVAQIVNEASREGARCASRIDTASESDVVATVQRYFGDAFPDIPAGTLNSAVTVNVGDDYGPSIPGGDMSSVSSGAPVSVQVIFQYDAVRWTVGFIGAAGLSMQTTTVMRRE